MSVPSKLASKKPQHNTKPGKKSKSESWLGGVNELLSWREYDPGLPTILALADDYLLWAQNPTSEDWLDFVNSYKGSGVPISTFYRYREKYPELKMADEKVRSILGSRKQKWATHKEFNCDSKVITTTLRFYHPDWQQAWQQEADLRTKVAGETNQPIIIELPALVEEPIGTANS